MNNLKTIRIDRGLTCEQLLTKCLQHVARPQYSLFENAKALPVPDDLLALSECLDAEPIELFGPDIDLLRIQRAYQQRHGKQPAAKRKRQGNPELRTRMPPEERKQFMDDINALGYPDFSAYMRFAVADVRARRLEQERGAGRLQAVRDDKGA